MSTNSVIARDDQHTAKGRYVHWDGYPTGVGKALIDIVNRDGLETARKRLTEEFFGWSIVDGVNHDEEQREPERFVNVPGYGVAYSHTEHGDDYAEDVTGQAYGYVLLDEGLRVVEGNYTSARHRTVTVKWDDPNSADLLTAFEQQEG